MTRDEQWMKIAIGEALLAMDENEVPVGAVLVQNNDDENFIEDDKGSLSVNILT